MAVTKGNSDSPEVRGAAIRQAGEQGLLFGDDVATRPEGIGYRGPTACSAAGITYRQLDYWARTGLVEPSVRAAQGSGSARLYSFRDILVLKVVKRLLDTGISLQQIRAAVAHLHSRGTGDLAKVTLMSDGVSVYECTSSDEVVDLLQGGQGVFGIALGRIWQEVDGTLADLPAEQADEAADGTEAAPAARTRTNWPGGGPAGPAEARRLPAQRRVSRPPRQSRVSSVALITPSGRDPEPPARDAEGATSPEPLRHPGPDGTGISGVHALAQRPATRLAATEGEDQPGMDVPGAPLWRLR